MRFEFSPLGKAFSTGLDKTAQGYQEEGVIKLLKDIRDGLRGGDVDNRLDRPDDRSDRPDDRSGQIDSMIDRSDRPDDRSDRQYYKTKKNCYHLLNEIDNINKKYKDTIDNINKENDDIKKLKKEVIDNKKLTKDILDESGKNINKFFQERLKYFNEFRYELERNSRIIEQRDDLLRNIVRHTEDDVNENQTKIDVLGQDLRMFK